MLTDKLSRTRGGASPLTQLSPRQACSSFGILAYIVSTGTLFRREQLFAEAKVTLASLEAFHGRSLHS
jgi:hypothetical protein